MEWPDIEGWMFDSDRDWIYNSLKKRNVKRIVEIGCYAGRTSYVFAKYSREVNGIVDCVDPWNIDNCQSKLFEFIQNMKKYDLFNNIRIHIETSLEFSEKYCGIADFVFVDGDHSYKGVKIDIEKWFPKTKYLCGHDFHIDGVKEAVIEFSEKNNVRYRKIEDTDNCWEFF